MYLNNINNYGYQVIFHKQNASEALNYSSQNMLIKKNKILCNEKDLNLAWLKLFFTSHF